MLVYYLSQFLAVFFLFKFLPVPVDFDVFLMGGDDFILNFIGALLALFLLLITTQILGLIDIRLDTRDRLIRLPTHLFNVAWNSKINAYAPTLQSNTLSSFSKHKKTKSNEHIFCVHRAT